MARDTVNAAALRELLQMLVASPPRSPSGTPIAVGPDVLSVLKVLIPCDLVTFNDLAPRREDSWINLPDLDFAGADDDDEPDEGFYDHFWSAPCSHPDRSGDWESVTAISDFCSLRQWRSSPTWIALGRMIDRELMLPLPSPPGHSRRIRFLRFTGACDYDETDRTLAAFVRPHLVAYVHAQAAPTHESRRRRPYQHPGGTGTRHQRADGPDAPAGDLPQARRRKSGRGCGAALPTEQRAAPTAWRSNPAVAPATWLCGVTTGRQHPRSIES